MVKAQKTKKMQDKRLEPNDIKFRIIEESNRDTEIAISVQDYAKFWWEIGNLRGEILGLEMRLKYYDNTK